MPLIVVGIKRVVPLTAQTFSHFQRRKARWRRHGPGVQGLRLSAWPRIGFEVPSSRFNARQTGTGAAKLTDKDTVVLADFANRTGEAVFDLASRQAGHRSCSNRLSWICFSHEKIAEAMKLMAQPEDARLTHDLAKETCLRTASAATIEGSIASLW